ncbi:MAG TPA: hypothetical protein VF720_03540 [Candidatus Eisenbacteria bacterium]
MLNKDLREFIELLNSTGVEFLIAGGHAVGFHGHPRFTGDIDIVVRPVAANASRVLEAIRRFGFDDLKLDVSDFTAIGRVIQLGYPPNRIDLLTSLSGVTWQEADSTAVAADLDGVPVRFLGRSELIRNKRATGRAQDLADLEKLEGN